MSLFTRAQELRPQLVAWRRYLHQFPELSFREYETQRYLMQQLTAIGLAPYAVGDTGILVDIGDGPHSVAIRADIDALPLQEESDAPFRSQHPGVMHACGHDGHTAILLGVAQLLATHTPLPGRIRLLFQPAEEQLPGGAQKLIAEGALEGIERVVGLHLSSDLDTGLIGVTPGPVTASADAFTVILEGKGGHGSQPESAVDPVVAAADLVMSVQTIVSRNIRPNNAAVVTIGTIHGGSNFNIIAPRVELTGTVRTFHAQDRARIEARLKGLVDHIGQAYESNGTLHYQRGYPSVVNTLPEIEAVERIISRVWGASAMRHPAPLLAGEDFAYYLERIPGAFLMLGCRNPAVGAIYPHHHPRFTLDEDALPIGVALLAETALSFLTLEPASQEEACS
ncbi:crowt peptidase m20d [Sulfobacillus acidophilus TPY]|uniref:Amidohydrolase n=1 Tax=Sulfobacillus acidophilus (strain ATCC 700253 / DSM 10332 / NAL) TaxID=679936 RepID=G8TZW3_SULAD|nr:crowt peptidase m20d [Sulfobacillus acidophilus TPY]AEW04132.1 amidohydrolase [Sulfobacillus acidophilus DSM 10332]